MLFAFTATDRPGQLQLRLDTRPDHVAFLTDLNEKGVLKFAGPFLDADGKPQGSLVCIEAENIDAAKSVLAGDPYAKVGLFGSSEVRAWTWTFNKPAGL